MDEVEHRRRSGKLPERLGILCGGSIQIWRLDGHVMDLLGKERTMIEKAFAQVREIPVRITVGSDTLIDLEYVHGRPRHLCGSQGAQHQPRCLATAYGHNKAAVRGDGRSCICCNDQCRSLG